MDIINLWDVTQCLEYLASTSRSLYGQGHQYDVFVKLGFELVLLSHICNMVELTDFKSPKKHTWWREKVELDKNELVFCNNVRKNISVHIFPVC